MIRLRHAIRCVVCKSPPKPVVAALIAEWVVLQIPLMILSSNEKVLGWPLLNLSDDLTSLGTKVLVLHLLRYLLRRAELISVMREKGRTVLRAAIIALSVQLRRIVSTVEKFDKFGVGDLGLSKILAGEW